MAAAALPACPACMLKAALLRGAKPRPRPIAFTRLSLRDHSCWKVASWREGCAARACSACHCSRRRGQCDVGAGHQGAGRKCCGAWVLSNAANVLLLESCRMKLAAGGICWNLQLCWHAAGGAVDLTLMLTT